MLFIVVVSYEQKPTYTIDFTDKNIHSVLSIEKWN